MTRHTKGFPLAKFGVNLGVFGKNQQFWEGASGLRRFRQENRAVMNDKLTVGLSICGAR